MSNLNKSSGNWLDGSSSKLHPATIWIGDAHIYIEIQDQQHKYTKQQSILETLVHSVPAKISFHDGGCFVFNEMADITQYEYFLKRHHIGKEIRNFEKSTKVVIFCILFTLAGLLSIVTFGLPALAKPLSNLVPENWIDTLDQEILALLINQQQISQSPIENYQQGRIKFLISDLAVESTKYSIHVYPSKLGANALALPGGTIILTKDFMEMGLSDSEIKSVLAHEIGHIELKHGIRGIIQNSSITVLLSMFFGDVSTFAQLILISAPVILQTLSYSRDFEREADSFALSKLLDLNISPSCLASALVKLENNAIKNKNETKNQDSKEKATANLVRIFSSHPETEERTSYAINSIECI